MEPTQEEELLVTVSKIVPTHSSNATYGCGVEDMTPRTKKTVMIALLMMSAKGEKL
jgi:hypothetical protein